MGAHNMPAAEVDIDEDLVGALIGEQHPDLQGELTVVANGWDNVIYRLVVASGERAGDTFTVRLPRRGMAAELAAHEQRWLPELAPRLPIAVPSPIRVGAPGHGFPWSWSICPWFDGAVAAVSPPDDPHDAARLLAAFIDALHQRPPPDAPISPYRGGPLVDREPAFFDRADQLRDTIDHDTVVDLWRRLVALPFPGRTAWMHGDLHPANLVVDGGRLVAVIDFGDIGRGDPATDLSAAWTCFAAAPRATFRARLDELRAGSGRDPIDEATWQRARGWALSHGLACMAHSADNPMMAAIGRATLDEVLGDRT